MFSQWPGAPFHWLSWVEQERRAFLSPGRLIRSEPGLQIGGIGLGIIDPLAQQGTAGKDLDELRKATDETWDKAKKNMDKAIQDLNGLYERTKEKVEGKDKTK